MADPIPADPILKPAVRALPLPSATAGARLTDQSIDTKVVIKAAPGSNAAIQLGGVALGSSVDRLGALICATRPNEWLVLGERNPVIIAVADLDTTGHMSVTDVTHGRILLRLSGSDSAAVLAKLCSLDLTDRMMPNGGVATTTVAAIRCDIIHDDHPNGARSYLLAVDASYAQYFADAITDAMAEFS